MKKASFTINRKAGYVIVYNNSTRYPVHMWDEMRSVHDLTHQDLANQLVALTQEEQETSE